MGGSSGGGGGSGKVDYPVYMKTWHAAALGIGVDGTGLTMTSDIASVIDAKVGNSPFATLDAYDPSTEVTAMADSITDFKILVDAFTGELEWPALVDSAVAKIDASVFSVAYVNAEIAAYNALVDVELTNRILPRFRRGMQDINAVNTSAFVIGEALLEESGQRDKDKFAATLRLQNYKERTAAIMTGVDSMVKLIIGKLDIQRALSQAALEKSRLAMIAFKEETDQDLHISELDGRWDLEVWNYAGNMLASIGAASVRTGQQSSPFMSALGAGMAGIGSIMMGAAALGV